VPDNAEAVSTGKRRIPVFVWVLVGVVVIISILMLIGVRTALAMRMAFQERPAKRSIQVIQLAEQMYADTYPTNGFSCSLTALGGDQHSGPPSMSSAQLIPDDLASGHYYGYVFKISHCTKSSRSGSQRVTGFQVTAVPDAAGETGKPGFCSDDSGVIKRDPAGGTNCTQLIQ